MTADCLVLNIQDETMELYIIYDSLSEKFNIWGHAKEENCVHKDYSPFHFNCLNSHKNHLYSFIDFILDTKVNVSLYNYYDLPNVCGEITFELLEDLNSDDKIITQYTDVEYDSQYIFKLLNMLSTIKNEYYM